LALRLLFAVDIFMGFWLEVGNASLYTHVFVVLCRCYVAEVLAAQ